MHPGNRNYPSNSSGQTPPGHSPNQHLHPRGHVPGQHSPRREPYDASPMLWTPHQGLAQNALPAARPITQEILLGQLLELVNTDMTLAASLLEVFSRSGSKEDRPKDLVRRFVALFQPAPGQAWNTGRMKALLNLAKKNWLSAALSLEVLLHHPVQNGWTTGQPGQVSKSTESNNKYSSDHLAIYEGDSWGIWWPKLQTLIRNFDIESRTPCFPRFELSPPTFLMSEGDVVTFCVTNLIQPVLAGMNALLKSKGMENVHLTVQSQYASAEKSYIDHMIEARDSTGTSKEPSKMVGFEEKTFNTMHEWSLYLIEHGSQPSNPRKMPDRYENMKKAVPQLRKCVFEHKIAYTMISDGTSHVGGIWDSPNSWTSRRRDGACVAGLYDAPAHRKNQSQGCQVLVGVNDTGGNANLRTGKEVLTMLILMALKDMGHGLSLDI